MKCAWLITLSTRISKIYILKGRPNFDGGTAGKVKEMSNDRGIYCYENRGVVNFQGKYQSLPPGTKIVVMPRPSYMPHHILAKS